MIQSALRFSTISAFCLGLFMSTSLAASPAKQVPYVLGTIKLEVATHHLTLAMVNRAGSGLQKHRLKRANILIQRAAKILKLNKKVAPQTLDALAITVEKLSDPVLPDLDKIDFAMECMSVVMRDVLGMHNGHRSAAIRSIRISQRILSTKKFQKLEMFVDVAKDIVEATGYIQATDAMDEVLESVYSRQPDKAKFDQTNASLRKAMGMVIRRK